MNTTKRRWLKTSLILVLILSGSGTILSMTVASETCSTSNCVEFDVFGATVNGAVQCREGLLGEHWAFEDACCSPSSHPDRCTITNRQSLGNSTRKAMSSCTQVCTTASCSATTVQPFSTGMFIEYLPAARYECETPSG